MSFDRILDQEMATRLLRNVAASGRIPGGMLFWGPGGVGKTLAAREFAKTLHCKKSPGNACDECLSCRRINHGNHPDVRLVAPAEKTRLIKKDAVDTINEFAGLRPFESDSRTFIILDADCMNVPAQNHFLKTLEEPPGRSVFILVTEYPRVLLPTIRSRCQLVRFRTLRKTTIADLLQRQRDLPRDLAESIAGIAEGQMARALDLVDSDKRAVVLSVTKRLAEGDDPVLMADEFAQFLSEQRKQIEDRVKAELAYDDADEQTREDIERVKDERVARLAAMVKRDIVEYLFLLAAWYRDELVYGETGDLDQVWNKDQRERLAQRPPSTGASDKILAIEKTRVLLDRFVSEERVFRDLFLTLAAP